MIMNNMIICASQFDHLTIKCDFLPNTREPRTQGSDQQLSLSAPLASFSQKFSLFSIAFSLSLPLFLCVNLSLSLAVSPSHPPPPLSLCLSVSTSLFLFLSVCLPVFLSVSLSPPVSYLRGSC